MLTGRRGFLMDAIAEKLNVYHASPGKFRHGRAWLRRYRQH